MIVVIDGPDGVGKTSLIENLVTNFPNIYEKFPVAFPTYKKTSEISITPTYLKDKMVDYLMNGKRGEISDLAFQYMNMVDKIMQYDLFVLYKTYDKIFLIDRYKPAGYVYGVQSMLDSNAFDGNEKYIRYINYEAVNLIEDPDFDVILYAEPGYLIDRIKNRSDKKSAYESDGFIRNICKEYIIYFRRYITNGTVVDATESPEQVMLFTHEMIKNALLK